MKISVIIAEDQPYLQEAMRQTFELFDNMDLQYIANHGKELLEYLQSHSLPDIVLMDINMPVLNGIDTTRQLMEQFPDLKILMLTVFEDQKYVYDAIMAGASGYLLKDEAPEALEEAILDVLDGGAPMSKIIARKALKLLRQQPLEVVSETEEAEQATYNLSKRELEVLHQIAEGNDYKTIAQQLFISPKTVRKHIENIYKKLRVHNKMEAVSKARKNKLLSLFFFL